MGNRAVITTKDENYATGLGIYLHWNGGRDSVEAFLAYCKLHRYHSLADLYRVIANYFDGDSVEFGRMEHLDCDNGDNGLYVIDQWQIVDRKYFNGIEQDNHDLDEMMLEIDECQPVRSQIHEFLIAEPIEVQDMQVGDTIIYIDCDGMPCSAEIAGFGADRYVNGDNVLNVPYTNRYGENPADNINNYLFANRYGFIREFRKAK